MNPPQTTAIGVAMPVTRIASRPPSNVRVNTSRPRRSVPNQCSEPGPCSIRSESTAL